MPSARVIRLSEPDSALAEEAAAAARIVDGVRNNDDAAKTEFIERYSSGLLRLAIRRVRDRSRAEGIVQETFSIALAKLAKDEVSDAEVPLSQDGSSSKNSSSNWVERMRAGDADACQEL